MVQRDLPLQIDGIRGKGKAADLNRTVAFQQCIQRQPHVLAEEVAVARGEQRSDVAADIGLNAAVRCIAGAAWGLRAKGHLPRQTLLPIGGDGHIGREIIQRPCAFDGHLHRRLPRQVQQFRRDAFGVFGQVQQQVQHIFGAVKIGLNVELAPFAIGAAGLKIDDADRIGQPCIGAYRKLRRLAQDRLAQVDLIHREIRDFDGDRQIGQGKGFGLGIGQIDFIADRQTLDIEPSGGELFDLQPSAQQGRTVPIQHHIIKRQPDAIVIRNRHPVKGGLRTQRPCESVDADGAARAAQRVLNGPGEKALVVILCGSRCEAGQIDKAGGEDLQKLSH